jgi:hypothetical protein
MIASVRISCNTECQAAEVWEISTRQLPQSGWVAPLEVNEVSSDALAAKLRMDRIVNSSSTWHQFKVIEKSSNDGTVAGTQLAQYRHLCAWQLDASRLDS